MLGGMSDEATFDLQDTLAALAHEIGSAIREAIEAADPTTADTLADDLGAVVGAMLTA